MRRRGLGWMMTAALAGAVVPGGLAQAQARAGSARVYSFNFAEANIADVANEVLGRTLGLPFAIDPAVTGTMTLRIERRLTVDQLLGAFETALSLNGVAMVRSGGQITLTPRAKAKDGARIARSPAGAGFELLAEPLEFATPSEIAKVLQAVGPASVVVHADDRLGLLILGGTSSELRAARETIALFDRSNLANSRMRLVTLKSAGVGSMAADLDRLLKGAGVTNVQVVPLRQLNAIILMSQSKPALDEAETWVARLDRPSTEEPTTLWVYRPRNIAAEALAAALQGLGGAGQGRDPARAAEPAAGTGGGEAAGAPAAFDPEALRVSVEKSSNSILVMAPASRWRALQPALAQLDQAPEQVLIEATVLEVTLNKEFEFGVDWSLLSDNGKVGSVLSRLENGAVQPRYPGVSLTYLNAGVRVVVSALASKTNVEVMSAPKLLALDNRPASLQIGDEVPVVTQRAQGVGAPGAPLVTTTEYRDTGVILKIKPRINGPDSILVDLSQEVSSVARTTTSGIDSPTIQQRKFESSLQLKEGQTVALGGLISSLRSFDDLGVPGLKDIPLAGALFKSQRRDGKRTELIVLLSARIVRADNADASLNELKASMKELEGRGLFDAR